MKHFDRDKKSIFSQTLYFRLTSFLHVNSRLFVTVLALEIQSLVKKISSKYLPPCILPSSVYVHSAAAAGHTYLVAWLEKECSIWRTGKSPLLTKFENSRNQFLFTPIKSLFFHKPRIFIRLLPSPRRLPSFSDSVTASEI